MATATTEAFAGAARRRRSLEVDDALEADVAPLSPISSSSSSSSSAAASAAARHRPLKKRRMSPPPPLPVAADKKKKKAAAAAAHVSDDEEDEREEEEENQEEEQQGPQAIDNSGLAEPSSKEETIRRQPPRPLQVFEAGRLVVAESDQMPSCATFENGSTDDTSPPLQPLSARPELPPPSSLAEPLLLPWEDESPFALEHHDNGGPSSSLLGNSSGNNGGDFDDSADGKRRRLVSYLTKRRRKITAAARPKLRPRSLPPVTVAVVSPKLPPMTTAALPCEAPPAVRLPPRVGTPMAAAAAMVRHRRQRPRASSFFPPLPPLPPQQPHSSVPSSVVPKANSPSSDERDVLEAALALASIVAPSTTTL